jgi:cellulose synthase/poly-beta-1,6-N-acetylglucosamine synthase-like glycosyltransferase
LPFLGGTNLFIQKDVLFAVDGFNYHSITEDLDLGIAIYLRTNN